jgi:hypothetical protein
MLYTIFGFALLFLLAIMVLPVPRVRQWLWTSLARMSQAAILACLGACGTFFVQPNAAPQWLIDAADPMIEGSLGMPLDATSGLPWLVIAVFAVGVSLPVLMLVELGLNLSAQAAQMQALRKEMRQAAAWVDSRLASLGITGPAYPPVPNEAAAAAEALRSANHADKAQSSAPVPLVIDLLK